MHHWDVRTMLEEEYKLLAQCNAFKAAFDAYALEAHVSSIPGA